jgi:adenylosuccinate synthase
LEQAYIILGLGFGDEGKGLTTDYICSTSTNPIVIRFNGGQQAGHNVVTAEGLQHVFSNFGSGTFRGTPTYWSKYCTFSPAYFLCEYRLLKVKPLFFLDRLSPVTTHYDVLYNRAIEASRGSQKHGSCGVGFGATVSRHYYDGIRLIAGDLLKTIIYKKKLTKIREYYRRKIEIETIFNFNDFDHDHDDSRAIADIEKLRELIDQNILKLVNEKYIFSQKRWQTYVFEGAQGIHLDIDYGIYPYVTKSNTTAKNALNILKVNNKLFPTTEVVYVTRAYSTRHGEGPFLESFPPIILKNALTETNICNTFQGEFKTAYLSIDLLNRALEIDNKFSEGFKKSLMITCLDQVDSENLLAIKQDKIIKLKYRDLASKLNTIFSKCIYSFSNCSDEISNALKG